MPGDSGDGDGNTGHGDVAMPCAVGKRMDANEGILCKVPFPAQDRSPAHESLFLSRFVTAGHLGGDMKTLSENMALNDAQLVELCLTGNRDAFGRVVARYQSLICGIAYSACGDVGRSEDLAQDTFIAAWRDLQSLKEPGKLKGWLCGIIRNLVNNSHRRESRTPTAQADLLDAD